MLIWYLLVWFRPFILWDYVLLRLKIQKIQRIGQFLQEGLDTLSVDELFIFQSASDLHILDKPEIFSAQVLKGNKALVVIVQFFLE